MNHDGTGRFHLGYTGTRRGMTPAQLASVARLCADAHRACTTMVSSRRMGDEPVVRGGLAGHHGDCTGGDAQFHQIMRALGAHMVGHPPIDPTHQANCQFDEVRPALAHLARNRVIVYETSADIAAPCEMTHQDRGGTWYTYDRAIKVGNAVALVLPDGSVSYPGKGWPFL